MREPGRLPTGLLTEELASFAKPYLLHWEAGSAYARRPCPLANAQHSATAPKRCARTVWAQSQPWGAETLARLFCPLALCPGAKRLTSGQCPGSLTGCMAGLGEAGRSTDHPRSLGWVHDRALRDRLSRCLCQGRVLSSAGQKDNRPGDKFQLTFPLRTNYMYAKVKQSLPEMYAFTVCMWLKSSAAPGVGTPFSYAVPGQANELVLIEWGNNPMEILINDKVRPDGQRRVLPLGPGPSRTRGGGERTPHTPSGGHCSHQLAWPCPEPLVF